MIIRPATHDDVLAMSDVLEEIKRETGRERDTNPEHVTALYLDNGASILCSVAVDEDGTLAGFQSLIVARKNNVYAVEPGWGIIGTHIRPRYARQGVGAALMAASLAAARAAGITTIDATIPENNRDGRAFYSAMGFRPYRSLAGAVGTRLDLA